MDGRVPRSMGWTAPSKPVSCAMHHLRIGRCLRALVQAIVAQHLGHTQAVVVKNTRSPRRLRAAVALLLALLRQSALITPERKRQQFAGLCQALETFDADEPVHRHQLVAQCGCGDKNVFTISQGARWSAIGMSGCFGCAAWAHAHASSRGVQSPDFAPTLRAVVFAGGLRRCGTCG